MSKSNKRGGNLGPSGDDRKKVNRSDRREVKNYLAEGKYEVLPKKQKLNRFGTDNTSEQ